MKKRLLFVLGRQPDLSVAELVAVFHTHGIRYQATRLERTLMLVESESDFGNAQEFLQGLGGTIKIVELDMAVPSRTQDFSGPLEELLKADGVVRSYASGSKEGRWTFGISFYTPLRGRDLEIAAKMVHRHGLTIKTYLKSRKRSSRFVSPRDGLALSSVAVRKNGLMSKGDAEIVVVTTDRGYERGKTVAVQDFEAYSRRDYGRPERDPKTGSLPPKLAQILLNVALVKRGGRIHDPFVGIGTVLQEAALKGIKASGSDISAEQVSKSKANLTWLREVFGMPEPTVGSITESSADTFSVGSETLDAIVTEGTLGPPYGQPPTAAKAQKVADELIAMWQSTLRHSAPLLRESGRIVLVLPVVRTIEGQDAFVPLLDSLGDLGYRVEALIPDYLQPQLSLRGTLIYERPDQVVRREIIRLTRI
jgi:tRNA G10  N-methylase Trm11